MIYDVNGYKSKAAALRYLRECGHKFTGLLAAPESNPKVAKNGKLGILSAPLHLAPFNLSGFQVCPQASSGCAAACLHTAGNPAYMAQKELSRIDRTRAYFKHRDAFMALLVFEIAALVRKADSKQMDPAIRLNATSDLPWEKRRVIVNGESVLLMEYFGQVQFYDYTKVTKRAVAWSNGLMPYNYHLTFSATESNQRDVDTVLKAGGNVAQVYAKKSYSRAIKDSSVSMPGGYPVPVVDGDETDYRPLDPKGVIVALKSKGKAIGDTSGFVVDWFGEYAT